MSQDLISGSSLFANSLAYQNNHFDSPFLMEGLIYFREMCKSDFFDRINNKNISESMVSNDVEIHDNDVVLLNKVLPFEEEYIKGFIQYAFDQYMLNIKQLDGAISASVFTQKQFDKFLSLLRDMQFDDEVIDEVKEFRSNMKLHENKIIKINDKHMLNLKRRLSRPSLCEGIELPRKGTLCESIIANRKEQTLCKSEHLVDIDEYAHRVNESRLSTERPHVKYRPNIMTIEEKTNAILESRKIRNKYRSMNEEESKPRTFRVINGVVLKSASKDDLAKLVDDLKQEVKDVKAEMRRCKDETKCKKMEAEIETLNAKIDFVKQTMKTSKKANESVSSRFSSYKHLFEEEEALNEDDDKEDEEESKGEESEESDDKKDDKEDEEETEDVEIEAVLVTVAKDDVDAAKEEMVDAGIAEDDIEVCDHDDDDEEVKIRVAAGSIEELSKWLETKDIDLEKEIGGEIVKDDEEGEDSDDEDKSDDEEGKDDSEGDDSDDIDFDALFGGDDEE